jgi:hypothetical protein
MNRANIGVWVCEADIDFEVTNASQEVVLVDEPVQPLALCLPGV